MFHRTWPCRSRVSRCHIIPPLHCPHRRLPVVDRCRWVHRPPCKGFNSRHDIGWIDRRPVAFSTLLLCYSTLRLQTRGYRHLPSPFLSRRVCCKIFVVVQLRSSVPPPPTSPSPYPCCMSVCDLMPAIPSAFVFELFDSFLFLSSDTELFVSSFASQFSVSLDLPSTHHIFFLFLLSFCSIIIFLILSHPIAHSFTPSPMSVDGWLERTGFNFLRCSSEQGVTTSSNTSSSTLCLLLYFT